MQDGANGDGSVFEVVKGGSTVTTLASFDGINGYGPRAGLIADSAGNLYGTDIGLDYDHNGTVFEVAKGSGTITPLATFDSRDGYGSTGNLLADAAGDLYGTAFDGGASDDGTVFELVKGSGTITTLASFDNSNGSDPVAGLLADAAGNLYGTTSVGGASNDGTVFELAAGSGTVTTLTSFNGADGSTPKGNLIADSAGNLYGTTSNGGASGFGTVFEVAPGSGTVITLATFDLIDGGQPEAGLIFDAAGNLYGTTNTGGGVNGGEVFEVAKGSGVVTELTSFYGINGSEPTSTLIADAAGNLYGTTQAGGANSGGTVFELSGAGFGSSTRTPTPTPTPSPTPSPTSTNTAGLTLTATKISLPTSLVVGVKLKGSMSVAIANATGAKIKDPGTIDLYATNAAGLATLIGTVKKGLTLANGRSAPATIAAKPIVLPAGTYTVLPTLTVGTDTSTAATGVTITVAAATVTLAAEVTAVSPATLAAGKFVTITLSLTNVGNVNSTGPATAAVTFTAAATGAVVTVPAVPAKATVRFGGKPVLVKLKVKVPAGTAAAAYDATLVFDQGGNTATAVGTTPFTVS